MARAAQATGGDLIETADRFIEQDAHDAQAGVLYHGRFRREEGAEEAPERDNGRDEHGAEQNGIEKAQAENARTSVRHPGCVVLAGEGRRGLDALALKRDEYKVALPCGHPLAERERIDIHELDGLPFLLLEHGGKTEVTELLEKSGVHPKIRFTTWEDYAIMAMAERGLGIGILPELILQRIPYRIEIRPLAQPYYRQIGLAMKDRRRLSPAAQSFVSYLKSGAE